MGAGYEVTLRTVKKNNNVTLTGLMIREDGANVIPTIYLEPYYEEYLEGRLLPGIEEEILDIYRKNRVPWQTQLNLDYGSVKDRIFFLMMNRGLNHDLLESMPHVEIGDLAVGFQWIVDLEEKQIGAVRITEDQTSMWNVTTEELIQAALNNTVRSLPPVLKSIEDVLREILIGESGQDDSTENAEKREEIVRLLGAETDRKTFPMYVLSNETARLGASSLLSLPFLNRFRDTIGEDFWILPSSIHEVILVPESEVEDREKLKQMVREINETQVPIQEFLSDEVYLYSEFEKLIPDSFRTRLLQAG